MSNKFWLSADNVELQFAQFTYVYYDRSWAMYKSKKPESHPETAVDTR